MKKRNLFKIAALTAVFALGSMFANAQTNPATANITAADADGVVVKVIDNKGTVKYLQSNNGITTVTSVEPGNLTRTTFQLGGTLTDDTYIDVSGKIFGLNGLELEQGLASTDAESLNNNGTGWTLLVRDEQTGEIKKMMVTDMVQSGWAAFQLDAALIASPVLDIAGVSLASYQTVYVYRNGAKLVAGIDYTVGTDNKITLIPAGSGTVGAPTNTWDDEAFTLYAGDKIEVHFIK